MHNGSLNGPWIPIYGIGSILIILVIKITNKINISNFIKNILLFVISFIILALIEFIGGHIIEGVTGKVYWDYSKLKFNIGNYISLEISTAWGIMSLVIKYILKPFTDKISKKIPSIITYLVSIIFIIDFIISWMHKI